MTGGETGGNSPAGLKSSQGTELSQELDSVRNGAFAKAVIEGLAGAADYNHDGAVSVEELNLYVVQRVKELTGGQQHPNKMPVGSLRDFLIALSQ